MIDPFSLATGIVGILSLSIEITIIAKEYVSSARQAPNEVQDLALQTNFLSDVLKKLVDFLRSDVAKNILFVPNSTLSLVLRRCQVQLESLHKKLEGRNALDKSKLTSAWDRLKWPLEKKECVEISRRLHECAQTFHFCLTIANCEQMSKSHKDMLAYLEGQKTKLEEVAKMWPVIPEEIARLSREIRDVISAVANSNAELHEIYMGVQALQVEADRKARDDILQWISLLQPSKRHQDVRSLRLAGTCQWMLERSEFRNWYSNTSMTRTLYCLGDPGTGKTIIASRVIDELIERRQKTADLEIGLAYVYCDYRDQSQQTTVNLVGGLLKQLLAALPGLPEEVVKTYQKKCEPERTSLELSDAVMMFRSTCRAFKRTYICVDALDECRDVIQLLRSFHDSASSVFFFITGRRHIQTILQHHFTEAPTVFVTASEKDIRAYIKNRVDENRVQEPEIMDDKLEMEITEKIVASSKGMFLLPSLHIRIVLEARTKSKRRLALATYLRGFTTHSAAQ